MSCSSYHNTFYSTTASFYSIGTEHGKIAKELDDEGIAIHKWRHNQSEAKRHVIAEGENQKKEIAVRQKALDTAKKSYILAARTLESSIQKRDELLVDEKKSQKALDKQHAQVNANIEAYVKARELYVQCIQDLQYQQLVFRDKMIQVMTDFESMESTRYLDTKDRFLKLIEHREGELQKMLKIMDGLKKIVSTMDEKRDISNFVAKHKSKDIPLPPMPTYESAETNVIIVNLPKKLDDPPADLHYPEGYDIHGYKPYVAPVVEPATRSTRLSVSSFFKRPASTAIESHSLPAADSRNASAKPSPKVPTTVMATAIYTFEATEANEMTIHEGEVIEVLNKEDDNWWTGKKSDGATGDFPAAYVQLGIVELHDSTAVPAAEPTAQVYGDPVPAVALYDYEKIDPSDLSIKAGQVLWVRTTIEENWYHATNEEGESGMIPANYVELTS